MSTPYDNIFNKTVAVSSCITDLYNKLSYFEQTKGIKSQEYIDIQILIRTFENYERKMLQDITSDSSILAMYKSFILSSKCDRLRLKLSDEYSYCEKVINSNVNEAYDELLERYGEITPREEFVSNQFEKFGKGILMARVFDLSRKKVLVKLLDYYIENTNDPSVKQFLIREKYSVLSCNGSLESWYFNYEDDNDCLLIDLDLINSFNFDIPLDEYLDLKNEYFAELCEKITRKALKDDLRVEKIRTFYETFILTSLLSMDVNSMNDCYNIFSNTTRNKSLKEENIDFIDSVYSKTSVLAKKIN